MIFNLGQYLRTKFPAETIYINSISGSNVPDRLIVIRDTGGTEKLWYRYSEPTVQILTRDFGAPASRKLSFEIFEELVSKFGLILPAIIIGSDTHPVIQTAQISAIQKPYLLDTDENGRTEYVTNYKIIFIGGI